VLVAWRGSRTAERELGCVSDVVAACAARPPEHAVRGVRYRGAAWPASCAGRKGVRLPCESGGVPRAQVLYERFGTAEDGPVAFKELGYFTRDPFSATRRTLFLGAKCATCERDVCASGCASGCACCRALTQA
jgi:hypothetical protein